MDQDLSDRLARIEGTQGEIKGMLMMLLPMLQEQGKTLAVLAQEIAELRGRVADMPTARDFGRLEGRVAEMSERLPTTIGYTPPRSAAG